MSKSEILYVKGMNISESEGDVDGEDDIWDDSKLNEAYDKALRMANAEVAKRVAMSTNSHHDDKNASKSQKHKTKLNSNKAPTHQWKAGMPCRAVYDGDGMEYEAFVLRLINEKECVVRFLGYDNSEIVLVNSLKPTQGKEARTQQIENAITEKDESIVSQTPRVEMELGSDRALSPESTERSFSKKKKASRKKRSENKMPNGFDIPDMPLPNFNMLRNFGSMEMPLPPPMNLPAGSVDTEDQAVSSMLLSWYMSGYYTGLYQGLKRSRENRRN